MAVVVAAELLVVWVCCCIAWRSAETSCPQLPLIAGGKVAICSSARDEVSPKLFCQTKLQRCEVPPFSVCGTFIICSSARVMIDVAKAPRWLVRRAAIPQRPNPPLAQPARGS